jgi:hypothetical protein
MKALACLPLLFRFHTGVLVQRAQNRINV